MFQLTGLLHFTPFQEICISKLQHMALLENLLNPKSSQKKPHSLPEQGTLPEGAEDSGSQERRIRVAALPYTV